MSDAGRADSTLRHPSGETTVFLGRGARERATSWVADWLRGRQVFLVTTPRVEELLLEAWLPLFDPAAELIVLRVEEGEPAKTVGAATDLWTRMLEAQGRRDSRVVALGGGSVGDLAGFVAATFLRGVEAVLIPTTLLAQVDASIGGKTGVDLAGVKNSVGSFHHPAAVISDVDCLASLPQEEIRSGLVEVIKIAAADDLRLFELLERTLPGVSAVAGNDLDLIVRGAVAAKIRVVESDPVEGDRRRLLNLGHTLGHAVESALDYRYLRHGEAVAYGILFATRLARLRGTDPAWLERIDQLIGALGLPPLPTLDVGQLMAAIDLDKKSTRHGVFWVLPSGPGEIEITADLTQEVLSTELDRFLAETTTVD